MTVLGTNITIKHYSSDRPLGGELLSGKVGGFLTAKVDCSVINWFRRGDPVVVFELDEKEEDRIKSIGGNIADIDVERTIMIISPDKLYFDKEKRQYVRYKVSLLGQIRSDANKRDNAQIKDISYAGLGIYSEKDLQINSTLTLDINLNAKVITNDGVVVRKSVAYGKNEYGIQLLHKDKQSIYYTQDCMDKYLDTQKTLALSILEQRRFTFKI